jgi:hypothetical protein
MYLFRGIWGSGCSAGNEGLDFVFWELILLDTGRGESVAREPDLGEPVFGEGILEAAAFGEAVFGTTGFAGAWLLEAVLRAWSSRGRGAGSCGAYFAFLFSSNLFSIASALSFLANFFSCLNCSLIALPRVLLINFSNCEFLLIS